MATDEGFSNAKASAILKQNITSSTYVGLSTTTPNKNGSGWTEPWGTTDNVNGYARGRFGTVNDEINGQITNSEIIFFFVALKDIGSVTHLGLFNAASGKTEFPFLLARLENPLTVNENYVPLIREKKLIIGLDKDELEAYA